MNTPDNEAQADIAWMRRLAEEGGQTPVRGASILFAAGTIYGAASLFHWAVQAGLVSEPGPIQGVVWLAATVVFLIVLVLQSIRLGRDGGVKTGAGRATGAVWMGVGYGIFALMSAIAVVGYRLGETAAQVSLALIPSVIMVFYGVGWGVTGAMQKSRALGGLSAASLVAAPLLATLTGRPEQYLAYAAGLFLLMALPGFMLMRGAGRS
jgi:hypothetical protein